jgi:serine/threonine-protein kinase
MLCDSMFEIGAPFERFIIEAHLGTGGMAKVFRARHGKLGTVHALKVLLPEYARDDQLRARFLSEGQIQARLSHPNIVRVTDTVDDGGYAALVMDYIEGTSLRQHLREIPEPPSAEWVRHLFLQVLAGVGYAHQAGVVHRDLKPENVMVEAPHGQSPIARVLDFGIAKVLDPHGQAARTRTGMIMGTPQYMSPEQLLGAREVTARSDIFSLGATLYVLATRKMPFSGATEFVVLRNIQQGIFELPEHAWRRIDPRISAAIVRALSPNPVRRFASCEEFAQALHPVARSTPRPRSADESGPAPLSQTYVPRRVQGVCIDQVEQAVTEPRSEGPQLEVDAEESYDEEEVYDEEIVAKPGSWFRSAQTETVQKRRLIQRSRLVKRVEQVPFISVDPGHFTMGSSELEAARQEDELEHEVMLSRPFALQATPVTQAQWQALMGNNPSAFKGLSRPVEMVSWYDAIAYCNALSQLSGLEPAYEHSMVKGNPGEEGYLAKVRWKGPDCPGYRLPTEAEWEYACRAGSPEPSWGEPDAIAWFGANSGGETHPVGEKQPNAWGFLDMLGLVWEWCWDIYGPYWRDRLEDPTGPASGLLRSWRGCSWGSDPENLRAAARQGKPPTQRAFSVGFRCARTLIGT